MVHHLAQIADVSLHFWAHRRVRPDLLLLLRNLLIANDPPTNLNLYLPRDLRQPHSRPPIPTSQTIQGRVPSNEADEHTLPKDRV